MAQVDAHSGSRASTATPTHHQHHQDDNLDPAAFLKSVRELSEKREREDIERYRKLEAEVERSRAQRAARRAERERSLSPEKSSTNLPSTPRHLRTPTRYSRLDSPTPAAPSSASSQSPPQAAMSHHPLPPPPDSPTKDIPEFAGFGSMKKKQAPSASPPMRSVELVDNGPKSPPTATSLARSGTLSWQQRPEFRTGSRPTSVIAPRPPSHSRDPSRDRPEQSRDQIAASLESRDPSWFKQTADRGIGSPAYKKSNDEADATPGEIIRRGLPGMSRGAEVRRDRQRTRSPVARTPIESPNINSSRDSGVSNGRFSPFKAPTSTSSKPDLRSLIAEDEAQSKASPMAESAEQHGLNRAYVMSPSQSSLTDRSERPSSPTKGFGGFVHSAAMKRSDSMTKRWSAQPVGASRPGSALSHVSGLGGLQGSQSMPRLEPTGEDSTEREGRSSSRNHAGLTVATGQADAGGFVKPTLPHSRSRSVASPYAINSDVGAASPVQKRFSPTKSSWIESALTRPESPKPLAPAKNTQPAWMANIAKAKAEKARGDYTPRGVGTPNAGNDEPSYPHSRSRSTSPTKLPFGQSLLKRSDSRDLAAVPPSSTPPRISSPPLSISSKPEHLETSYSPSRQNSDTSSRHEPKSEFKSEDSYSRANSFAPGTTRSESITSTSQPVISKAKPVTPPKPTMDFRSNLKPRAPAENKPEQQPEFLSKFGNLKRTKTEKYVAEDVLKREITRGKAELNKTDGPVKTARRDELKESLLAKKEEMRKAKEEGRDLPGQAHERKHSNAPITPSKPEALAKRELLGRSIPNGSKNSSQTNGDTPNSMRQKPEPWKQTSLPVETQPKLETLSKQTSAPDSSQSTPVQQSKLAARFNPALAGILARGPPSANPSSSSPSRSESPARMTGSSTEPPADGAPLQDMRKGRAKGPKKRRQGGGGTPQSPLSEADSIREALPQIESVAPKTAPKPRALPGSAASLMVSSLGNNRQPPQETEDQPHNSATSKPTPRAESTDIPEFGGFGAASRKIPRDDDKENTNSNNAHSDKAAEASASFWNRHRGPTASPRTQSPARFSFDKNDDLAMLGGAETESPRDLPPKPARSSRVVSGQLREGSPNK